MEEALCGMSVIGMVWSVQVFFRPIVSPSPLTALPSSGVHWSHCHVSGFVSFFFSAARVGLMHIGVFILLLLSGERNFGVRLNKPYSVRVPMDIPVFTGTHADLLIIVSTAPAALFCPS